MVSLKVEIVERLPWHVPAIQCLVVNLNTGNQTGSGEDEFTNGVIVIPPQT